MVRIDPATQAAFADACAMAGVGHSMVVRELIAAATRYIQTNGHWKKPMLVADTSEAQNAVAKIIDPIIGADDAERVLASVIDRVLERRERMVAAEPKTRYGMNAFAEPAHRLPIKRAAAQPHKSIPLGKPVADKSSKGMKYTIKKGPHK